MTNLFESLGLSEELLSSIKRQNYNEPTPVQAAVIPEIIEGKDMIATAQTGTGKTAGFTLPLLQRLTGESQEKSSQKKNKKKIRGLIVVPTRELAVQVFEAVKSLRPNKSFIPNVVFGGVRIGSQIAQARRGCDVLIATPGRLLDLSNQRAINLSHVEMLVLDEADRMLDMGFIHDIQKIIELLPEERQNLLFSATGSKAIQQLAKKFLNDPVKIEIARKTVTAESVTQKVHYIERSRKQELLTHLLKTNDWNMVLVFSRTKLGADRLAKQLGADDIKCITIHGDKSQQARMHALKKFKSGKARILIATDVASRGLDIDHLPCVINYDLPDVPEDYVHRIGRTGRAANTGEAISLVSREELRLLRDIEKLISLKLIKEELEGFEQKPFKVIKKKVFNRFGNNRNSDNGNKKRFGRKGAGNKSFGYKGPGRKGPGNKSQANRRSRPSR